MEKITEYKFDRMAGERDTVTVWHDAENSRVLRCYKMQPRDDYSMGAEDLRDALSAKPYDKLFSANKIVLDFLNARLGG